MTLPLLAQFISVGTIAYLMKETEVEAERAECAQFVASEINIITAKFLAAVSALAAYGFSKNTQYADRYQSLTKDILDELRLLDRLAGNDSKTAQTVRRIQDAANKGLRFLDSARRQLDMGGHLGAFYSFEKTRKLVLNDLVSTLHRLGEEERKKGRVLPDAGAKFKTLIERCLFAGLAINTLVALILAVIFNKSTSSRLSVLIDNTVRLASQMPLNKPLAGKDEIAQLDKTFHEMVLALEEARRKERAVVENAADLICALDENGRFSAASPSSIKILGYASEELVGKNLIGIAVDKAQSAKEILKAAMSKGETCRFDCRLLSKNGTPVDTNWSVNWSPKERSFYCVVHDVTAAKQVENMKREFLAIVSHDLRTPLSSTHMFLSMLNEGLYGELSKQGKENVQILESEVNRLINLVNDLLDIERMESGKLELRLCSQSLLAIIEKSISVVSGLARAGSIKMESLLGNDIPIMIDEARIMQVMVNLLSNAIKFSPSGGSVKIEVKEKHSFVEVRISDQGRGIAPELKNVIFDRFKQLEHTDATEKGGSGLGLAICKAIVQEHGGTIGVESEAGKGSTFWFEVPKAQDS